MEERAYQSIVRSENRRKRYRARRIRQIRRRCFMAVFTVLLVIGLAVSFHAFSSVAASKDQTVNYKYYTSIEVAYGDSLWSIAERYAGEEYTSLNAYISEVVQINHLKEESVDAGQFLIVPYYSTELKY